MKNYAMNSHVRALPPACVRLPRRMPQPENMRQRFCDALSWAGHGTLLSRQFSDGRGRNEFAGGGAICAGQSPIITANAPVNIVAASAPAFTQIVRQPNGVASMTATGSPGVPYTLRGRTNLATGTWTSLSSGTVTNSPFVIQDGGAVSNSTRFCRFSTP